MANSERFSSSWWSRGDEVIGSWAIRPCVLAVLAFCSQGCGRAETPYDFLTSNSVELSEVSRLWADLPFDRIQYSSWQVSLFGADTPGQYYVTLERGGLCVADGVLPDGRSGSFEATLGLREYARLCQLVEELDLRSLSGDYEASATHQIWESLKIQDRAGHPVIEISEYGGIGPSRLWAFKQAIHSVVVRVDWIPESGNPEVTHPAGEK